ncbi:MAG: hypothetical protein EGQ63_01710 [Clostridiales bacterium]|nr:hypothetical protein [Agathobacter rectalis]MBD8972537.1 hypothetical protein [Clostridiales bacterium]
MNKSYWQVFPMYHLFHLEHKVLCELPEILQLNPTYIHSSAFRIKSMISSNERSLSIYESVYPIEGTKYIFLDKIQYTDNWELWMKVIYDSRKDILLTATGSASPVLGKGATDSGTGRWSVLKIPTMSFYEYCRLLQLEEPILALRNMKRPSRFCEYLP